ncbi:putative xylanase/chitin deacetylase [Candidatus Nitrososphaera evergladensis SR1]|uniref:Putative xylanase/chitin deacetylase n=1 Tax=Candidatus Nitrososphaera evergladensis SR1 TaxID=1459636 RepID=A0A075MMA9_9ARCH|nr:chitobiase/beta-hexosaminidase C-terminal domain-containing protein [Candidatus Nitrososphaera evergladensis]AIF82260.1 putative xylanase/chitin deacetylase [Candidatus Nitrososphaera evergladensis SR1]
MAASFLLVLGAISTPLSAQAATIPGACNCVIFRLDDIQDFWLNTVQVALMDHFIEKSEKLTVGTIMNFIGNDPSVVDKVRAGLDSGTFELASHAWNHVDYRTLTPQEQHDTLQQANQKMTSLWGSSAVVFIPPYNAYNDDTLAALQALKMKVISAEFDQELPTIYDPDNPNSKDNKVYKAIPGSNISDSHGIYHLPQVIGFYTYDSEPPTKTAMNTLTSRIDSTISSYGYAVVTLHPQDFAVKDSSQNPTNQISSSELADLDTLIKNIQSKGYAIRTYSQAIGDDNNGSGGGSPSSPPPSSEPPAADDDTDKTAPQITAPADIVKEATGVLTPVSLPSPSVHDDKDPSPHVTNDAPGGGSESGDGANGFPVGTTTVKWNVTDASGNSNSTTQKVTITDTTPPSTPKPLSPKDASKIANGGALRFEWTEATDLASPAVRYDLVVADNPDFKNPAVISQTGLEAPTYNIPPPSGSEPLANGTYYWKVRASDSYGNQSPYSEVSTFIVNSNSSDSSNNGSSNGNNNNGGSTSNSAIALTASPPAGTYSSAQLVTLSANASSSSSATNAVTIYYTTDGSDPAAMTAAVSVYSAPIPIASTTTLKFIARDSSAGNVVAPTVAQEYVIQSVASSSGSSGGGSGGGGGGGGGGSSSGGSFTADGQVFTYADSHFAQHPLDRIQLVTFGTMNLLQNNIVMTSVNPGQPVNISATFKNYQNIPQSYVFITQVEKDGITFSIDWTTGTVNAGQTETASRFWTPADNYDSGNYTVKVFVWDQLSGSPVALSEAGISRISVVAPASAQQQHSELPQM